MVGQLDQLVPPQYVKNFEPMLMQAPKTAYADVKSIVELELGQKIEDVYSEFDE